MAMLTQGAPSRASAPLLIAFADLTRFAVQSLRVEDDALADTIDAHYERVVAAVTAAGGRVVKFIGDAALIVFPAGAVDPGVTALLDLKRDTDAWFAERGWECRLMVKVHFGDAVAGDFGGRGAKRFDVIGRAVNIAAMLDSTGVALTADAFRKLGPALRQRFKKHTPPISYIRTEDAHRDRRR